MPHDRLKYLFARYYRKTASDAEVDELMSLIAQRTDADLLGVMETHYHDYMEEDVRYPEARKDRLLASILRATAPAAQSVTPGVSTLRRWLPYVAAAVIAVAGVAWFFGGGTEPGGTRSASRSIGGPLPEVQRIQPGGNRATLTLAGGKTIDLSEAQSGIIVGDGDITYLDGSSVENGQSASGRSPSVTDYQLATPKGGTYRVTLPDGTDVWLNAASTLTYPSKFTGTERIVKLHGEAYFQVRRVADPAGGNGNMPFKVMSRDQTVEVLGTAFNVSAYPDEPTIKTTLVEGRVNIATPYSSVRLTPGQQAVVRGKQLQRQEVDTDVYTAWKDGVFVFYNANIEEMMRQVGRWYDVEVEYRTDLSDVSLLGIIPRSSDLSATLARLENTGELRFHVEGRRVIVMK